MRAFLPLLLLLAASCRREETITRAREPKEGAASTSAGREAPGAAAAAPRLRWSLPTGWKELAGSGMRVATLIPSGGGKAEATVISLPGDVGGELANVNRWRGQLGLAAIDEGGLAATRARLASKAGSVSLYDMAGSGQRTVAGTLASGGATWFLKLTGDADAVAAARPDFVRLLESLHAAP